MNESSEEKTEPIAEENASEATEEQQRRARAEESQDIDASQIPPANFPLMVSMFTTQAMGALGLMPNPITGKVDSQPTLAKHYIEMLGVLEEKTKGNLDPNEEKLLQTSLHELRIMFVQATKK